MVNTVRVRMYRQGLGECFLITIPTGKARPFYMMIDCGIVLGSPGAAVDRLRAAVADVIPVNVATEDLKAVESRLKMTQGFDVGMEMSGNQQALDQMVEAMVMGGRIAMLGIPPGKSPVDWSRIVFKAITIKGVYGREIFETWYKMIAMLENGLDVRRVITHRYTVDEFRDGFEVMRSGRSGKVVLDWG